MKQFLNILPSIVVVVFALVVVLLLVSSVGIPGVPLDARTVLTGSMEPAIPTGSVVFIYPREAYAVGDIVTYRRVESMIEIPITHRIVSAEEVDGQSVFHTKGDANEYADINPVSADEVYGKVVFHLPFVGRLLDAAKTPWGFAALIVIPALLVIFDEVGKIVGQVRRKEEETEAGAQNAAPAEKDEDII